MKTLVYILPDKDAGVASVIRNLLRFKTNRYKTKVLLIHNTLDSVDRRIKDDFHSDKVIRITYNAKWSSKYAFSRKIFKELDTNSVIIINDGGLELHALKYVKYPVSITYILHGNFKHYYNAIKQHQNRIGAIVSVSDFLSSKIDIINTEVVIKSIKFPVPNAKEFIRFFDASKMRLVFVGTLISSKGIFNLKTMLNQLNSKNVPFSLHIIGSGVEEKALRYSLKAFSNVIFKGKMENEKVLEMHKDHDIILLPSETEGLPVVLVEAMKYGVVPMATNLESGIPEIIDDGKSGYTVPLDAINEYADWIEQLHLNRKQLKVMSQFCVEKSEQMFNPQKQTKLYEDVFVESKPLYLQSSFNITDYFPAVIAHRLKRS